MTDPYTGLGKPVTADPYDGMGKELDPYEELGRAAPTQGAVTDAAKRTGRSLVDQPGAVVESGGTLLDAMERVLRAYGAGQGVAAQGFLPENLREQPELPAEAMAREMRRPSEAARVVQDTGRQMRADAGELYTGDFAPDPARNKNTLAQVADSVGPLAASLATPGRVVAKTITGALLNSQSAADAAEQQLIREGKTEQEARNEAARQFVLNLPAGALESVAWGKLLGRYGKALEDAVAEKWGKSALERVLKAGGEQAVVEGGEEMAQTLIQNAAAKGTYDRDRKLTEGMAEAGKIGAIMGGGLAGGVQTGAEIADRLDTGRNRPERPEDLQAQQAQLVKGDRVAQMFPLGTKELPLPEGMKRVETPRGVFHFNPRQMTADQILSASQAGRENDLLGLGPYSKTEVQQRVDAGEPVAMVTERGPKGEELRGAVATPSTVAATREAMEQGKSEGSTVSLERMEDVLRGRGETEAGGLDDLIDQAANERQEQQARTERETKEREARQTAVKEKREKFDFHLGNAQRLASGVEASGAPAVAEVAGVARVLRDYVQDNTLGLTMDQKQQARALLGKLEPVEMRLKAEAETATQTRLDEDKRQREAAETAQKQRIAAERTQLAAQKDIDPVTGRKRLEAMTEDELVQAAEGGSKEALRLLEQRSTGQQDQTEDLLTVLKRVQLPASDPTMGSELEDLKREWVNFGDRQQLFSAKPGSLDTVAEVLRSSHGFTAIQTPADVIEFTKRVLRGEKILPDRPGGQEQVSFATAEAVQAPRRPTWDQDRGREQMPAYMEAVQQYDRDLREYAKRGPDVLVFRSRVQDNVYHLVSRNVREGEKPWRMTEFEERDGQMVPVAHRDFATKEEAVMSQATYTDPAPEVEFADKSPAGWGTVEAMPAEPETAARELNDFEARLQRIAPGLMLRYQVLVGGPEMLLKLGVRREQLNGRQQAAHLPRAKALWFLAKNIRADKDGMMPERLRRDVLHETTHAWLDGLDRDTRVDLRERWEADKADPRGWLATRRKAGDILRAGVETSMAEYWCERLAQENSNWAARREGMVSERGFVGQLAYDFRVWLQEALDYLREAFTRTKRYNVDFRAFLKDGRYSEPAAAVPVGAAPAPQPIAAAQGEAGFARYEEFNGLMSKKERARSAERALKSARTNLEQDRKFGNPEAIARSEKNLREAEEQSAYWKSQFQKQSEIQFATEENPAERQAALIRQLNNLTRTINDAEKKGTLARRRGLLGQRNEIRTQLDSDFPNWRKEHPEGPDGLRKEKATEPTDQAENAEPEPGAVPAPEREFAQRPGIYSEVEGHTTVTTPWLVRKWEDMKDVLRGIRGSIPELPAFADDKAQQYLRLRQFHKLIKRGTPRVWKEAADQLGDIVKPLLEAGPVDAKAYARLGHLQGRVRKLKEENRAVPTEITEEIADLNRAVEREPYGLFQKIAMYLDLKWRVENLKDEQGNAIAQPGGLNVKEINDRLDQLKEHLNTSPHRALIMRAIKQHQATVKTIAEDLRTRDLTMPEEMQNPFYYPHIVLDKGRDTLDRVKLDTAEDFRAYLLRPVGSTKPIETDYAKAMYYHLVAVGSHNLRSDLVRDYLKPYDKMEEVRERAKELAKQYGRPVSWREAFATEYAKNRFVTYHPDDKLPLHPEMTIDRDTLARRLGVILTEAPLQQQLEALGLKGIKILPEDIKEALAAGEQETWILPEKVGEALNGMLRRETKSSDSLISKPIQLMQAGWKRNILFAPWNYPRYEFNNTVADLEKLFSADPEVFRLLPKAAKEVRAFIEDGKGGKDVHEAFKRGVLDSVTAAEVNDLTALRQFEKMQTDRDKWTKQAINRFTSFVFQPFGAGNRSTLDLSRLREATFRYAKFKADLERLRNGARPVYAGAYWRDIDAIEDSRKGAGDANYQKAAEISLATFGDYQNISVAGQEVRRYLVPFYSWMEINFKYHANLLRNLMDMTAAGELSAADAAKAGGRAAAVAAGTFTRKAAAGALLRLALPYLAVMLWNNSGDREELEETLSAEDKRRFHIILGKDANGKTMVVYGQTAFADVAKWFGGMDAMRLAADLAGGRTDFSTALGEWLKKFHRDFFNNLWQVGPAVKIAYTAMSGKSSFPDVTDQRTIPANEVKWNILGQATDQFTADLIRRAVDKDYLAPRDTKDWAMQTILQVRKRDPQQWAFYEIKDKAADYLEAQTGQSRDSSYNAPDQQVLRNFRKAIYRGDVENAMRFYDRLLELGYTSERFQASIRAQDPLSALPKDLREGFVATLSKVERAQLTRAYEFYARMTENRGAERALFPSKRMSDAGRANYQPRHDRLVREMQSTAAMTDEELVLQAEKELRRSLRPSQR